MTDRWYRDGLRFECTRCGDCCTGAPGVVWVTHADTRRLAKHVGVAHAEFRARYLRREGRRYSLIERANGDCVFWSRDAGCLVYEARPPQCRTFPFWPENLARRRDWDEVVAECPGAGRGRLYRLEDIERIRRGEAETGA